ncbi:MAG: arginine--tRNA ligase [Clostridiales bacterium GWE2_32_10]|nr:MAG: arginine--tRNA ligase [Clostridiales bacterium GWE2_32_10]HBY20204.1 arginine--tRNA ligase [Clostridiales bacterium]
MKFKENIASLLAENILEVPYEEMLNALEVPPDSSKGDFAFPCFRLSKLFRKAPNIIAEELSGNISKPDYLDKIEAVSGYINFFVDRLMFSKQILDNVNTNVDFYKSDIGGGKTIVIDYSHPNIAKPFHVGSLRTTIIGAILGKIFKAAGYNFIGTNYLGDWGTQFGKLIVAYKKWGNDEKIKENGVYELVNIYIKFHQEVDTNPALEDEGRAAFADLERGNPEYIKLWNWFKEISLVEFNKLYKRLEITFNDYTGESYYILNNLDKEVINNLNQKNLLELSEGAYIVNLEEQKLPPCIVLKSNGSTIYATRDLAAAIHRMQKYNFYKCIYITDYKQSLHFKQFFTVLDKMNYPWAKDLVHIPYGFVTLESGKMATREGNFIVLDKLIEEAKNKVLEVITAKNPDLENKEEVAEQVGLGAIIFNNIYNNILNDIVFKWETALRLDGETGPYVQYTHARTCSLIKKNESLINLEKVDFSLLTDNTSFDLVKLISSFPDSIIASAEKYEPMYVARHLIEICKAFNKFYNEYSVLVDDDTVRNTRLYLVNAVKNTLREGLNLLCIKAPEKM